MVSQAMMSLVGHEIPLGRSTADQELRFEVFDIIHPYCLSPEDMEIVNGAELNTKVMWLETFTNMQKEMLGTRLLYINLHYFKILHIKTNLCKIDFPGGSPIISAKSDAGYAPLLGKKFAQN